jgi:hypothetical protein
MKVKEAIHVILNQVGTSGEQDSMRDTGRRVGRKERGEVLTLELVLVSDPAPPRSAPQGRIHAHATGLARAHFG